MSNIMNASAPSAFPRLTSSSSSPLLFGKDGCVRTRLSSLQNGQHHHSIVPVSAAATPINLSTAVNTGALDHHIPSSSNLNPHTDHICQPIISAAVAVCSEITASSSSAQEGERQQQLQEEEEEEGFEKYADTGVVRNEEELETTKSSLPLAEHKYQQLHSASSSSSSSSSVCCDRKSSSKTSSSSPVRHQSFRRSSNPSWTSVSVFWEKPRVLIIITGGTICMSYEGLCSSLKPVVLADRLRNLPEMSDPSLPDFDIYEWENLVDSSDVGLPEWISICDQIHEYYGDYDGFVVLHGTDTMAYTTAALSFMLENLGKPVIFTGAMLPMVHIQTDAKRNLAVAMMVAGYSQLTEVCLVFGSRIMRGSRVSKIDCSQIDAFDTPNFPPLGRIGVDIVLNDQLLLPASKRGFRVFKKLCMNVVVLTITPGFSFSLLRSVLTDSERPVAVVLQLYGSGTAPGEEEFLNAIRYGIDEGVAIVAVTQCLKGTANLLAYENGAWLSSLGVINGKDMTIEACIAKLSYLIGKGHKGKILKELMEVSLRGEVTQAPQKVTSGNTDLRLIPDLSREAPETILSSSNSK